MYATTSRRIESSGKGLGKREERPTNVPVKTSVGPALVQRSGDLVSAFLVLLVELLEKSS